MSQEVGDLLARMSGILGESFNNLRSTLDVLEKNIIQAINKQKNEEISNLRKQLEAKEKLILDFLKSKDDLTKNLNS